MTRAYLAVTTALFAVAALWGTAAEACISCNYVPEVVNTPVPGAKAKKAAKPERTVPKAKKQIAKRPPAAKEAETAKGDDASKTIATKKETTPAEVETSAAPSSGSATAALAAQAGKAPEPEAVVGCKKFSATAGTTVTVPCE